MTLKLKNSLLTINGTAIRLTSLIAAALIIIMSAADSRACTSAIIGAELNPSGRPILWKHRDTSNTDNKVEYVPASGAGHAYVALFNAADRDLKEAWMGMNDVGFAVMNTASYNIKDDKVAAKNMDKEGFVMTRALKYCKSVDDFAMLLDTLPRPMGVEANFGVIDASGNGAFFETNNHSYKRYNLSDADNHILVRTNYSHSGRPGEGYGFVRESNANCLLAPYVMDGKITPELLTEEVSRTFYHDGRRQDYTMSGNSRLLDEDFIPRYKSTATVAIEGMKPVPLDEVNPGDITDEYIMWTGLGYPPVAEIRAVRCRPDGVEEELRGTSPNGHSVLADEAKAMRDDAFTASGKKMYIDMRKLYKPDGSGFAQIVKRRNAITYKREKERRDGGK